MADGCGDGILARLQWWCAGGLAKVWPHTALGVGCTGRDVASGQEITSLTLKQSLVAGCKSVAGTVTLSGPAPAEGLAIMLTDTLAAASTRLR